MTQIYTLPFVERARASPTTRRDPQVHPRTGDAKLPRKVSKGPWEELLNIWDYDSTE